MRRHLLLHRKVPTLVVGSKAQMLEANQMAINKEVSTILAGSKVRTLGLPLQVNWQARRAANLGSSRAKSRVNMMIL